MKIAFVYDVAYPWHVGGVEYAMFNEAKELAQDNEVHFFCMRWPGMKADFTYQKIHYHTRTEVNQQKFYRHGRRSIREAVFFSSGLGKLADYKFDVVVTNFFPMLHVPVVYAYCKRNKAKMIIEVAEVWNAAYWQQYLGRFAGLFGHWYSRRVLKGGDFYITNSTATEDLLIKEGIEPSKTLSYCPVLEDAQLSKIRKTYEKKQRQKKVVFSGRLIKEKRIDKWLKVFDAAHLKDTGIRGVIIGDGPELENINALIRGRGMQDFVEVKDFYKDKTDYYKELASASLVLNMSEREGLSILAIESIALGTPVLLPSYTPIPNEIKSM